jgi:hypothetical protein
MLSSSMVSSPYPEGEGKAMLAGRIPTSEGATIIPNGGVHGSSRDASIVLFAYFPHPLSSGTTGVAQEQSSGAHDPSHTLSPYWLINTLERLEQTAHRGDRIIFDTHSGD